MTLAACLVIVVVTCLLFKGETGPDGFDNTVDSLVIAFSPTGYGSLVWFTLPGALIPSVTISAAIAGGCLVAKRLNGAVLAVAAVPAAAGWTTGCSSISSTGPISVCSLSRAGTPRP